MAEALKNQINKKLISLLASDLIAENSKFKDEKFLRLVKSSVLANEIELKLRISNLATALHKTLPGTYQEQVEILKKVAPKYNSTLMGLVFSNFVELYCGDDWDYSLKALKYFTKFSTAEYAIRLFIRKNPEKLMQVLKDWAGDKNVHVRRLASEGCRPRLPWARVIPWLKENPDAILAVLEKLKDDPELYVKKSVANNLNDISKDYPNLVLNFAKKWYGSNENINWIIKHALRNMLKSGNQSALDILAYKTPNNLLFSNFILRKKAISIGEHLEFSFDCLFNTLSGSNTEIFRIEYAIHFLRANKTYHRKVYKIKEAVFSNKIKETFVKKHLFIQRSTRTLYKGEHKIEIIINGKVFSNNVFVLKNS